MSVKCKACGTVYVITRNKTCPTCGANQAGHKPSQPGVFSLAPPEPVSYAAPPEPASVSDSSPPEASAAPESTSGGESGF